MSESVFYTFAINPKLKQRYMVLSHGKIHIHPTYMADRMREAFWHVIDEVEQRDKLERTAQNLKSFIDKDSSARQWPMPEDTTSLFQKNSNSKGAEVLKGDTPPQPDTPLQS